ncbi:hypothetical protein X924_05550 [Petrotoga sp. 9PWA.NaAc.5.4]|nr:hypothetical protein X924_05550 [Petrotoga sp. 9PWA.NaAc.5.4]
MENFLKISFLWVRAEPSSSIGTSTEKLKNSGSTLEIMIFKNKVLNLKWVQGRALLPLSLVQVPKS